jgi:polyhydroxyalkanoate synthesis repressor PhaR
MVKEGKEFVVRDAKTGEDITRTVLTQIIFEEENKGQNLLPLSFLRKLIGYYGHNLEALVPRYLESSLELFQRNQDAMQRQFAEAFGEPLKQFEEMSRQNMAMFERALSMFNPFALSKDGAGTGAAAARDPGKPEPPGDRDIETLRRQLDAMRAELDTLTKSRG